MALHALTVGLIGGICLAMMMALSAALWALALGIFAVTYLPILAMDKLRQY